MSRHFLSCAALLGMGLWGCSGAASGEATSEDALTSAFRYQCEHRDDPTGTHFVLSTVSTEITSQQLELSEVTLDGVVLSRTFHGRVNYSELWTKNAFGSLMFEFPEGHRTAILNEQEDTPPEVFLTRGGAEFFSSRLLVFARMYDSGDRIKCTRDLGANPSRSDRLKLAYESHDKANLSFVSDLDEDNPPAAVKPFIDREKSRSLRVTRFSEWKHEGQTVYAIMTNHDTEWFVDAAGVVLAERRNWDPAHETYSWK